MAAGDGCGRDVADNMRKHGDLSGLEMGISMQLTSGRVQSWMMVLARGAGRVGKKIAATGVPLGCIRPS